VGFNRVGGVREGRGEPEVEQFRGGSICGGGGVASP